MDITAEDDILGLCNKKKFPWTCVQFWTVTELCPLETYDRQ